MSQNDKDKNNNVENGIAAPKEEQAKPLIDPATVALPRPSSEERTFHANTLLEAEDQAASVSLPPSFAAKYLWTHDSLTPSLDDAQNGVSRVTFNLPGSLSLQAASLFRDALSPSVQAASVSKPHKTEKKKVYVGAEYTYNPDEPNKTPHSPSPIPTLLSRLDDERPMTVEPFVTLFCPYEHTSDVLDVVVHDIARREGCDVVVLDSLELAQGRNGTFGEEAEKFLKCVYDISGELDSAHRKRQVFRFLHALLHSEPAHKTKLPSSTGIPRPRLVYLRDFGSIAMVAEPILRALIKLVRLRRMHPLAPSTAYGTRIETNSSSDGDGDGDGDAEQPEYTVAGEAADIALLQRTVIVLGISSSLERASKTSHPDCPACIAARDVEREKERQQPNKYEAKKVAACVQCSRLHLGDAMKDANQGALHSVLPSIEKWDLTGTKGRDVVSFVVDLFANPSMKVSPAGSSWSRDWCLTRENVHRRVLCMYNLPSMTITSSGTAIASSSDDKQVAILHGDDPWNQNETTTQKARISQIESACLEANERALLRKIAEIGGTVPLEGNSLFAYLSNTTTSGSLSAKEERRTAKTSSLPPAENLLRKSGFLTAIISGNVLERVAIFARELAMTAKTVEPVASDLYSRIEPTPSSNVVSLSIHPVHVIEAVRASLAHETEVNDWLGNSAKSKQQDLNTTSTDKLVHNLRKGRSLSTHERSLIQNVIDRTQLKTSFKDVCLDPHIIDHV
ncbi:hypothetical protein DL93DRAFT_2228150, partial [Clavulina sp. PMI_390]